jgi:hypothetical protein
MAPCLRGHRADRGDVEHPGAVAPDRRRAGRDLTLTHNLNKTQPPSLWPSWRVTQANSAHDVLVVDVEARRVWQALTIAETIVEPLRSHGYLEVLIYGREPGHPDGATRRVQWTPGTGFVESAYGSPR